MTNLIPITVTCPHCHVERQTFDLCANIHQRCECGGFFNVRRSAGRWIAEPAPPPGELSRLLGGWRAMWAGRGVK